MRLSLLRAFAAPSVLTVMFLAAAGSHAQTTIHVPADQPTIQAGINAANNGDTVLVAPGTYYENIDFKGKAITVTSSGGAAGTIVDGGGKGPVVTFKTSESSASVVSNFTIQNGGGEGAAYLGSGNGGIYIDTSAPTILGNIITHNNCWGIETYDANPLIKGNEISATQSPVGGCGFGSGAGIYIGGNRDANYSAGFLGAGLPAIITGNVIENNMLSGLSDAGGNGGAAVAVWGGSPVIENNIMRNNSSPGGAGGAINVVYGSGTTIIQNLIYSNSAGF